jgi:hypothetical protein
MMAAALMSDIFQRSGNRDVQVRNGGRVTSMRSATTY